jgi:hypothetical protein
MLRSSNQLRNDTQVNNRPSKSTKQSSKEDANQRIQIKAFVFTKGMSKAIASLNMDSRLERSGS